VEFYSAPIIGGAHLKIVHKSESKTVIIEPMSLVFGEPAPALLQTPVGLPVSMEHFNRIHAQ
jgi:hypothetical protein